MHVFSLLHSVQTNAGAHTSISPVGSGYKEAGRDADHSSPSGETVKKGGAILPLPRVFMTLCLTDYSEGELYVIYYISSFVSWNEQLYS
jgi:hypothetical protein